MLGRGSNTRNNFPIKVARIHHWSYKVDTLDLKAQSESSSCMPGGMAFLFRTVLGKKDICFMSVLQPIIWNPFIDFFLEKFVFCKLCIACRGGYPSACLVVIASSSSGACHWRLTYFDVCWWQRALRRASEYFFGYEDPILYLRLMRVKYNCCFMATDPMFMFLDRKPRVLLAFAQCH